MERKTDLASIVMRHVKKIKMDTQFKPGDFVTIASVHRQHGYNIKICKGRIAKIMEIETKYIKLHLQNGSTARILPKYLAHYVKDEFDGDDLNYKLRPIRKCQVKI